MTSSKEIKYFDIRTCKRNVEKGFIKSEDLDSFIKNLPDDQGSAEEVSFEESEPALEDTEEEFDQENSEENY